MTVQAIPGSPFRSPPNTFCPRHPSRRTYCLPDCPFEPARGAFNTTTPTKHTTLRKACRGPNMSTLNLSAYYLRSLIAKAAEGNQTATGERQERWIVLETGSRGTTAYTFTTSRVTARRTWTLIQVGCNTRPGVESSVTSCPMTGTRRFVD
jgi:hypothetical protein